MSFILIYEGRDGKDIYRTVSSHNLRAIAAEMHRRGKKNLAPVHILLAKLENELRKTEGR